MVIAVQREVPPPRARAGGVELVHSPTGLTAHVRRAAQRPIATVLCVHGGLDGATSFSRVARRLADADVVAYDRRGYRESRDVPVRAGLDAQIDDLDDVARATVRATGSPVVVLGHSLGGLIALGAAARGAVPGLVGVVAFEAPFPWGRTARPTEPPPTSVDPAAEAESFFRRIVGEGAWDRLGDDGRTQRRLDGPALVEDLLVLRGPVPFDTAAIDVPVIIGMSEGAPERRRDSCDALASRIRTARLVAISGAGHGAHLSSPDKLAAMVRMLLDDPPTHVRSDAPG